MPPALTATCMLTCSFGAAPTALVTPPLPGKPVIAGLPVALATDVAIINVPTFGMCTAPTNPTVISLTAAALGVLTPAPCVPVLLPIGWVPPSPVAKFGGVPIATTASTATCSYLGVVSVTAPMQAIVAV